MFWNCRFNSFTLIHQTKEIMKALTLREVDTLRNAVFVRLDFKGDFRVLHDAEGNVVTTMSEGKAFVRSFLSDRNVQLSTFEQAMMNNAVWDNA